MIAHTAIHGGVDLRLDRPSRLVDDHLRRGVGSDADTFGRVMDMAG